MAWTDAARDERPLLAYLLRLLPEDETADIEEQTLADDDVAARLRAVEHDLVDAYVRGTLDSVTRGRFEAYYMSSPIRRERVRFATQFLRTIDAAAVESDAGRANARHDADDRGDAGAAVAQIVRVHRAGWWRFAAVAAGLVLASSALLLKPGAPSGDAGRAASARVSEATRPQPPSVPAGSPLAMVLLPQTRAVSQVPALTLPAQAAAVGFELQLESNDYPHYQAALRDPATNATIWRSEWSVPVSTAGRTAVAIAVPVSLLKRQHYSLDLSGRAPAGATHVVGSYAFNVTPP